MLLPSGEFCRNTSSSELWSLSALVTEGNSLSVLASSGGKSDCVPTVLTSGGAEEDRSRSRLRTPLGGVVGTAARTTGGRRAAPMCDCGRNDSLSS